MSISQASNIASEFDSVTTSSYLGKTDRNTIVYTGVASNKWSIGEVPNGGYVMAMIIDSVIQAFAEKHQTDPVALNCFFFAKTLPGNYIVEIDELKMSKKGYCVVRAILKQTKDLQALNDVSSYDPSLWTDKVQGIFTMGNMSTEEGLTYYHKNPAPPSVEHLQPYLYTFMGEYVDCKFDMGNFPKTDQEAGRPEVTQTMSFKDGRPIDFKSIPYWCDMFITPPALLGPAVLVDGPIWCPTMQLEVQFKRKPTGKTILAHFLAARIINGRFDVDGIIWNEDGEILATTRHQCLVVPWSRNSKDTTKAVSRLAHVPKGEKSKI